MWHRRMGHTIGKSVELLNKTDGNGVSFRGGGRGVVLQRLHHREERLVRSPEDGNTQQREMDNKEGGKTQTMLNQKSISPPRQSVARGRRKQASRTVLFTAAGLVCTSSPRGLNSDS